MFTSKPFKRQTIPRIPVKGEMTKGLVIPGPLLRYISPEDHSTFMRYFAEVLTIKDLFEHVIQRWYELGYRDLDDVAGMLMEDVAEFYIDDDPMNHQRTATANWLFAEHFDEYLTLIMGMHLKLKEIIPRDFVQPPAGMSYEQVLWKHVLDNNPESDIFIEIIFVEQMQ